MKISVVIPAYNRVNTLKRAIDSVLNQSYKADEIIVIDDGSSDATSEIAKTYTDVIVLRQNNMGVSTARNNGMMMASNEWIAFLDSDDEWHKDKLLIQTQFHKNNPNIKASYTDEIWIKDSKEIKINKKHKKQENPSFESSLEHCQIGASTVLIDKALFNEVGNFNEDMEVCEDYDLWLRILKKYEISLVQDKLTIKYADEENQLSKKYWALDVWHIKSLFLHVENVRVQEVIKSKYNGLVKAATKYKDKSLLSTCEEFSKMMNDTIINK